MDRWKFVNEKWIPRPVSRGEGFVSGIAVLSYRSLPHWGRGTASAVDRVLSYIACLRRSPSLSFIPLEPYPARSARHLPHAGKALSVDIVFPHISCIRSDNARKAVSSYRSLPHGGRGTAPAVDRVLSFILDLRRISPLIFHTASTPIRLAPLATFPTRGRLCIGDTAFPIQPPPLRGTSFHRKEGMTTRAPSLGRGCRAQRGGVGFLFCGEAASSLLSPCRESCVILVPSSTTSIALTRASQRGAGSILRLFDRHAFSGGNPLHSLSNVLQHRRRGQDRPARGIPLCGYSL